MASDSVHLRYADDEAFPTLSGLCPEEMGKKKKMDILILLLVSLIQSVKSERSSRMLRKGKKVVFYLGKSTFFIN